MKLTLFAIALPLLLQIGCASTDSTKAPVSSPPAPTSQGSATSRPVDPPALLWTSGTGNVEIIAIRDQNGPYASLIDRFRRPQVPDEVFGLDVGFPGGGFGYLLEVEITGPSAELRWHEKSDYGRLRADRYFARPLSAAEVAELRNFIAHNRVDSLKSIEFQAWDGVSYDYVHVTPTEARSLTINNPGEENGVYFQLVQLFEKLADASRLKVHYNRRALPPGADLLFASLEKEIDAVWAKGDDVRVLVSERNIEKAWHSFSDGKLGPVVAEPDGFDTDIPHDLRAIVEVTTARDRVITPDQRWMIGTSGGRLIRYDLTNRREADLNAEIARTFHAREYIPAQKKVLLVSYSTNKWGLESQGEKYRLLDPATGASEEVGPGNPEGLNQPHARPYQPTTQPDIVWIAFPNPPYSSYIGRYDMKTLRFRNWFTIESFQFGSDDVCVDDSTARVYVIHDGHLFRFGVPKEVHEDWKF